MRRLRLQDPQDAIACTPPHPARRVFFYARVVWPELRSRVANGVLRVKAHLPPASLAERMFPLFHRRDRSAGSNIAASLKRIVIGASLALCAASASAADFTVTASGVVPGPGAIRFVLYRGPDGFRHEERAYRILSAPADKASVQVRFQDLPPGAYAVMAYHDANDNKKLDLRFGMFPKEGWGLSNNPKVIGPPRFEPSAVSVTDPSARTDIIIHY